MRLLSTNITEPLTLAEVKAHCRIDIDTDDSLLTALITVAREQAEAFIWQKIPEQEWEIYLGYWPANGVIELPGPVSDVEGVYYTPGGGEETEFGDVVVDLLGNRVLLKTDSAWPADTLAQVNPIRVEFTTKMDPVPSSVKAAMLLIIGHLYEHREDVLVGVSPAQLPKAAEHLMWPYRVGK